MSLWAGLRRGYALRRLTGMFEGFAEPVQGAQYQRNTRVIGHWLDLLRGSSPQQITHALFQQMKRARRRGNAQRFNAQTTLLALMVESNLALDLATYSAFLCAVSRRQAGS